MGNVKYSPFATAGIRERFSIEERILKLLFSIPSRRGFHPDEIQLLEEIPLGDRSEILNTINVVLPNLQDHVKDLLHLKSILESRPRMKLSSEIKGIIYEDIKPRDVISIWEEGKRKYYIVISKSGTPEGVISVLRLTSKFMINASAKKAGSVWTHRLGPQKLKLARIEKRNINPQEIGADQAMINKWKDYGYLEFVCGQEEGRNERK